MRKFILALIMGLALWGLGRKAMKVIFAGPFPAPVSKELYATDFRGCKAPELVVKQWLSPQPETAGKVILVDFWATWCGPCRAAIPELNELQARFKDDLVVIGLSGEDANTVRAFRQEVAMKYTVACDSAGTTAREVGVEGIPNVMIISTDGIVRWQGIPMSSEEPLTPEVVKAIIDVDPGVAKRHGQGSAASVGR